MASSTSSLVPSTRKAATSIRRPSNGPAPVARNWAIPARCLARRFHLEIVKKLVTNSLGFASGRRIEFRSFAGKGGQAINGDYMQDLPKPANDLVEDVPRFPTMLRLRIREERFLISARFSFF